MKKSFINSVCSPATLLMDKLRYSQKFGIIILMVIILAGGIIYLLLSNLESQKNFSQKEVYGIEYINPLKDLLYNMQEYRKGNLSSSQEIQNNIQLTDNADKELNETLSIKSDWENIKNNWNNAKTFEKQTSVINQVISLISHINDTSNLVLDPDLDTYYLMDAYSLKLPNLLEKINQAEISGNKRLLNGTKNDKEMIQLATLIDETNELLKGGLSVIYNFNPSVKSDIDASFNSAYRANRQFLTLLNNIIDGKNVSLTEYETAAKNALTENKQLYNTYASKEKQLIEKRVKKYSDQEPVSVLVTLIALFAIGYLFAGFYFSLVNSLNELETTSLKVAQGDLTVKTTLQTKDEIANLAGIFNKMTDNLNNLVKQVSYSVKDMYQGTEEMSTAADQTAQGAQQVAVSVSQLAVGYQQQAHSVNDSLKNINGINNSAQKISLNSDNVAKMAVSTESHAKEGCDQAQKAVGKIKQIKSTAVKTSETANKLSKLGSDIEQIIDLIKGIAAQTNLLALNAAIEAARAGEHGKGFAVVADEVKKLAGQSAEATEKVTDMIKEIQSKTDNVVVEMDASIKEIEEGVVVIGKVGDSLAEILSEAQNVSKHVEESLKIAVSLTEDSDSVVKMMENISSVTEESSASAEEISSITQEQTASLEEINASSQTLARIAENLQRQVSAFRV